MKVIRSSVGNKAQNNTGDVSVVQGLINANIERLKPCLKVSLDGDCGPITVGMIIEFQNRVMGIKTPDGRVDPGKNTIKALNEYAEKVENNAQGIAFDSLLIQVQLYLKSLFSKDVKPSKLTEADFTKAAALLNADVAAIKAVASVESSGSGFLNSGKPKVLFEGHQFSKRSGRKFDKSHPTMSYKKWTKIHYKKDGSAEYSRYLAAKGLDSNAAMESTSWGKFQIMGFNYKAAGFSSVLEFVEAMHKSEGHHLMAFISFLKSEKLDVHLKSKNWASFARGYNGESYAVNKYDIRLKQAYKAFSAGGK